METNELYYAYRRAGEMFYNPETVVTMTRKIVDERPEMKANRSVSDVMASLMRADRYEFYINDSGAFYAVDNDLHYGQCLTMTTMGSNRPSDTKAIHKAAKMTAKHLGIKTMKRVMREDATTYKIKYYPIPQGETND